MKSKIINRLLCSLMAGVLAVGSVSMPAFATELVETSEYEDESEAEENENTEEHDIVDEVYESANEEADESANVSATFESEDTLNEEALNDETTGEEFTGEEFISEEALGDRDYSSIFNYTASDLNVLETVGDFAEAKGYWVIPISANNKWPNRLGVEFAKGTITVTGGKVEKQCNNAGARIMNGDFATYPFTNVAGEIRGGIFEGGIYQKTIKGNDSPADWNQIIIDAGKTIKIGGVGLVVTNGNVINKGTMDLSEVNLEECITKTGIFRSATFINLGHIFQNDGLIILPSGADASFIKGLKITGTGKIKIGSEEYANDYDAAAEAMLAFKSGLPVISADENKYMTYKGEPVAEIDLNQYVKGGTKPYTFSKVSGPEWVNISEEGIVSGTPTQLGQMSKCEIRVTDKANATITGDINIRACYLKEREEVTQLDVGSNLSSVVCKGNSISKENIAFSNAGIKLKFELENAVWQKKTGTNTYVNVTSGNFELGETYRCSGIRISNNNESLFGYQFDTANIKVYIDGEECNITDKRGGVAPNFHSYVKVNTPDIVAAEKRFEGLGTPASPWTGLNADSNTDKIQAFIIDDVLFIRNGAGDIKEYQRPEDYPWYPYRNSLKGISFNKYITNIPAFAFKGFKGLEEIVIPTGIKSVGESAFEDCTSLKKVSFSNELTALDVKCFKGCSVLTDIALPQQLKEIKQELFMNCISLETIEIPNTVLTVRGSTFENCKALKNVALSGSMKSIPVRMFFGCTSLEVIDIPENVDSIGGYAFCGCNKLKAIDLHKDKARNTGRIGANAFENCGLLKNVELGKYKEIGEYAFKGCSSLENITFPATMGLIGNYSFQYCTGLKTIVFEGNIEPGVGLNNAFTGLGQKNNTNNPKVYFPMDWPYSVPDSSTLWCGGYLDGEKAPEGEFLGIEITKAPTKIHYKKGEMFDPTGMVVMAHYSDNTDVDVTSRCEFTPNTPLDTNNNTITVTFTSKGNKKSATTSVYVIELQSLEVVTPPNKVRYYVGEFFDSTGVKVVAHYTANVDEDVTAMCSYAPATALKKTDDKVTVSYTELSGTYTAEIPINVFSDELLEIRVEQIPDKTLYKEGELFDKTGLKVVAYFDDETSADVTGSCTYTPSTPLLKTDTKITASYTKGMITKSCEISIEVAADFEIELGDYDDTYSGKIIKPAVTVRDNNLKTLLKATDYKVFYNNNIMPNDGPQIDSKVARYFTEEAFTFNKTGIESYLAGKTSAELGAFNPALPYVVIQGIRNYSGATFVNYNIKAVTVFSGNEPVAKTLITIPEGYEVGRAAAAITRFTANGKAMVFGRDYTFEIWQGLNQIVAGVSGRAPLFKPEAAGEYTLKIFCKGGYAGTYETSLFAAARTELISTARVVTGANVKKVCFDATDNANFVKIGDKIKLANENLIFANAMTRDKDKIMVTVGTNYLTTDDFTVSYINNEAVGTATVKLTPKLRTPYEIANGAIQYAGTKTFTFNITGTALNVRKFTVDGATALPAATYDSLPWTLERLLGNSYVVENDGVVLTKGTHYKVSYIKNINRGTATVTFEGIPAGGYTGIIRKTIKINQMTIDSSMLTVNPQFWPTVAFTKMGGNLDSNIRLKLANGYKLNYGTDYAIRYVNNKRWGADAYLIIDGKGNFKGTTGQLRFTTVKKNLADGYNDGTNYFGDRTISVRIDPIAFVNNAPTRKYAPKAYVYDGTAALLLGREYTTTLINCDTATIQIYMNDRAANYNMRPQIKISAVNSATSGYAGDLIVDVPIKEKQLTMFNVRDAKLDIALGDVRYSGNILYAPVTVKYDNVTLSEGRDYTLQYGRSFTGKGTVTVYGRGEYYGSVKKTFTIKGKNIK